MVCDRERQKLPNDGYLHSDYHLFRSVRVLLVVRNVLSATARPGCRDCHSGSDHIHPAPRWTLPGTREHKCSRGTGSGRGGHAAAQHRHCDLSDATKCRTTTSHATANAWLQSHARWLSCAALSAPAANSTAAADADADANARNCSTRSSSSYDEPSQLRLGRNGELSQAGTVQSTLHRTVTCRQ